MASYALLSAGKKAARSAAEAAAAGAAVVGGASWVWSAPDQRSGLWMGGACAWAASSVSVAALLAAKASGSVKLFWRAFAGGMAVRLAVFATLMWYGYARESVSQPALLLSYALGTLCFLLLEYRHIKIK